MNGTLDLAWGSSASVLLALLTCAPILADCSGSRPSTQPHRDLEGAAWPSTLARSILIHVLVLSPAWYVDPCRGLLLVACASVATGSLAALRRRLEPRNLARSLMVEGLLLGLEALAVVGVWYWWQANGVHGALLQAPVGKAAAVLAAYAFNAQRGSRLVAVVLRGLRAEHEPMALDARAPGAGQIIGILERWVLLTLVVLDQWGGIGLVFAAKSVARFKELESNKDFAETYLVGTLASVLVAMSTGILLRALL